MMALDIAPGSHAQSISVSSAGSGHDRDLWHRLMEEANERRAADMRQRPLIFAATTRIPAPSGLPSRMSNAPRLRGFVHVERRDLSQLTREGGAARPAGHESAVWRTHRRSGAAARSVYELLGQKLREQFEGWKAAVFTGNPPLAKSISINARRTHTLFNGRIECRLLRFDIEPDAVRGCCAPRAFARGASEEIRSRPGAQMFANRLRKNLKAALRLGASRIRLLFPHLRRRHA